MKKNIQSAINLSRRQGFTLMEVLVSSALTVVILTMLFTVLIGAMNAWQTGTNRLQGNADARMALDSIAQDLQSMVVRQTTLGTLGQEWIYANTVQTPNAPAGLESTWLTFFAPSLDRQPGQQGDIVAISYRVGYQDALAGTDEPEFRIFGLYKHMFDTRNTFQLALGLEDTRQAFWEGNPTLDANPFSPGTVNSLDPRSLLIPNVVDFTVNWKVRNAGVVIDLPSEFDAIRLNNSFRYGTGTPTEEDPGARIDAADISLTILTDEGMRMVQTFARAGTLPQNLDRIIREHGRVYTKRVKIEY
ncbi:MAG: prepilin-type N-terminal cleavage/methylation domain-containing protein [Verrucomicrobia bacterium]|nr:prepilin-type N-terminal cleavage/methylation domain-containing protein [Verrucomicrobiota bacterium]MCH8527933.1 prepilin-type N-terminal cleavage/methylation domain-containing protein [Kiritimatiellia bacterium]